MQKRIVCFGEMLWDVLPEIQLPGGAPMNVAIHLSYNGFSPIIISRVGNDPLGRDLISFIEKKKLASDLIQLSDEHPTGVVNANASDKREVNYEIVSPAAWDFISLNDKIKTLVKESEVFVYGSLSGRNNVSGNTLLSLLEDAKLKVFDVNFRSPHYEKEWVELLLEKSSLVKVNEKELFEITQWYGAEHEEEKALNFLRNKYGLQSVIVTKGENGAAVLTDTGYYQHPGFRVKVEDTIGSGDAFLATFLSGYLKGTGIYECLEKACKVGALVASKKGATPEVLPKEIDRIS